MDPAHLAAAASNSRASNSQLPPTAYLSSSPATAPARRPIASHGSAPKIRRRNRLITSCLECRRRKLKCDKQHPCGNCTKFVRDCVFLAPALDPEAQLRLAEIKEKMGSLERTLEDDVARRRAGSQSSSRSKDLIHVPGLSDSSEDEPDAPQEEKELEPTPLAFQDAAYYEDADDDLMDLGIKVGKMRITDRLGGFVRPKLAYEIGWVMNQYKDLKDDSGAQGASPQTPASSIDMSNMSTEAIVKPGLDYIAPSSSFFFAPEPTKASFMHYLPSKYVADRLLIQYWDAVHYMCRIVHRPSFERQYASFWDSVAAGIEPPASLQAIVLAAMLSAVISMPEESILLEFGVAKAQLLENFQKGTETALSRANFLRTTKLMTLQAFVMYLIPLCRREVSRAHSALTGTAIRLAECMGLHRDGSHYQLSPVEVHVRRMVWAQLCFLDLRTCEATGPRPQIHKDDFDTKFPLNVNDDDLEGPNPPTEDADCWTDMTFSLIRFEANEMHRYIWFERPRLEKKKTTLTAALSKVQNFWNASEQKYVKLMDKTKPMHYMAFLVYKLYLLRMHVMLLHRYGSNGQRIMPDRLRKILLSSATQQVECAITVETAQALRPWAWYCGAFMQYHTTLLLLTELYAAPERYFQDRIWKCLDYVFELPESMDRKQKARLILTEVMQKSAVYHNLRKVRAPKAVEERVLSAQPTPNPTPSASGSVKEESISPGISPPITHQQLQQHGHQRQPSQQGHQRQPSHQLQQLQQQMKPSPLPPPNPQINLSNIFPANGVAEFRSLPPQLSDAYYAPGNPGHPVHATSPQSSDPGSYAAPQDVGFRGSNSPNDMMLDIDWNEWDKLFPPEMNIGDLNIPDFNFPSEYTLLPQHQQSI